MKIAELFVAIGFELTGDKKLDDVDSRMTRATLKASALAIGINAINYAFLKMVDSAARAATGFLAFETTTGMSARGLQSLQINAAQFNVTAEEVQGTLDSLQKAGANVRLDKGNVAPFTALGITEAQNPTLMLEQIRQSIRGLTPEIARLFTSQLGISDKVFSWISNANTDLTQLNSTLVMTNEQQADLVVFNRTWGDIKASVSALKDKLAAEFAPALTIVARGMKLVVEQAGKFLKWLGSGTAGALVAKGVLLALAAALGILGIGLAAFASVLTIATVAMTALTLASSPLLLALTGIVAILALFAAALVTVGLLLEDYWTQFKGGKSFFDWNDNLVLTIKNLERLRTALHAVVDVWGKLDKYSSIGMKVINPLSSVEWLAGKAAQSFSSVRQENKINVHVQGDVDARSTGETIGAEIADAISVAGGQMAPQK